jgi:outer membrane biosynthesis protein TonB
MDLSKILSISGRSGLFQVVSQLKNAVLVESLLDKKRFPAFAHEKISSLEEIAIFTATEDKPLKDVLKVIYEKLEGKPALDAKSDNKLLTAFFVEVVPDYDSNRVYISDIRKIISWYNLLIEHQLLDFTEKEEEKPEEKAENKVEEKTEEKIEEKAEEPPVTVPAAKKKKPAVKKTEGEETTVKKKETVAKKKPKSNPS